MSSNLFILISVECVVGPNVNTFSLFFHIFRIENFEIRQCEHIEASTDFSFQTQFFAVCLNFQQQNPLKN
jgi:hypothetical protein